MLAGLIDPNIHADIIAGYDFGSVGGGTSTLNATTVASGVSTTAVDGFGAAGGWVLQTTLGDNTGFAASGTAFGATDAGNFSGAGNGATGASLADAISDGDYVNFTITADLPGTLNVSGFSIAGTIAHLTNNRPAEFFNVIAQPNGGSTWDASGALFASDQEIVTTQGLKDWDDFFVDLSGNFNLQGVDSVEFRVYFWGGSGGSSSSRTNYDQIVVEGSIGAPVNPIWQVDGSGDWSTPANWLGSVPNAASDKAIFSDSVPLTAPLTASLDVPVTLGELSLQSAQAITIGGPSALTLDGGGAANVSASSGSHVISAAVSLTDPLDVASISGAALDISGALSGTTTVTNSGEGQLTLSGDLSGHTGSIVSDAGTLVVSGTSASDITANAGSLIVSGTGSDITVNAGAILSGEGSATGTLLLAAGNTLNVDPTNGTSAFTAGTLSPTAPVEVGFSSSPVGLGAFTVLNYTSYAGVVATDFVSPDYRISFADDMAGSITATVAAAATRSWAGTDLVNPTFWDIGTSTNWSEGDSLFFDEDSVTFTDVGPVDYEDGATGSNVRRVDVQEEVAPGTMTFTNTFGNDWEIQDVTADVETIRAEDGGIIVNGGGNVTMFTKITGNTDITHSGTGILYLGGGGTDNDFVGTITVDGGGELRNIRNPTGAAGGKFNSLGDFGNTLTVTNGSTFDAWVRTANHDFQNYGTGSFIFGHGTTLANTGTEHSASLFGDQLVFQGDITLEGGQRFDINDTIDVTGTDIVITMENDEGNVIGGDNSAQSIGEWVVNDGTLFTNLGTEGLGNSATVTVNADGRLTGNTGTGTDNGDGPGTTDIGNSITLNGGKLSANQTGTTTIYSGTVTVVDDSVIDPDRNDRTVILNGTLTESGAGGDLIIGNGTTRIASGLTATGFTGDFIFSEGVLKFELENGVNLAQDIVVADSGNFKNIVLTAGNSAEISGNITINEETPEDFDFDVQDGGDTLTVSGAISGGGAAGVAKTSAGSLILSGQNSYVGNSVIYNGIVTLTSSSRTTIYPTTNATTNQIDVRGSGVVNADGELYFDLDIADTTAGNSWDIIIGTGTVTPGGTFTVNSSLGTFLDGGTEWTLDDGSNLWTFDLLTGALSVTSAGTPFDTWMAQFTTLTGPDTDPGADPDGDNVDNFTEFAFDGNPEDGSNNGRIHVFSEDTVSSDMLVLTVAVRSDTGAWAGSDALTASSAPDGIDYTVEGSLDLLTFDQAISEVSPVQDTGLAPLSAGYKWQSFKLNGSEGLPGKGFMRAAAAEVAE